MEKVTVLVNWSEAASSGDPAEHIRALALRELELGRSYQKDEVSAVGEQDVFKRSIQKAAEIGYRLEKKRSVRDWHGKEGTPETTIYKVAVHYERPATRGFLGRPISNGLGE